MSPADAPTSGPPGRRGRVRWHFQVDVVGGCNLSCPSCPVGNSTDVNAPKGVMAPEVLDEIVRKAKRECETVSFYLYNWTEPFAHPRLHEMIRVVHAHGVKCGLSTNLNLARNLDAVLEADPDEIKISLSGFDQGKYAVTHRQGKIDVVKANMKAVAAARDRAGSQGRIVVAFHRYLGNHEDEARMREYAHALGFEFEPAWAYLMPLEKVMAVAAPESTDVRLTDDDRDVMSRFALPVDKALEVSRRADSRSCKLRDEQMVIDCKGNVMLCCSVFDPSKYALGSYLDQSLDELQAKKNSHWQCGPCMEQGVHVLGTYGTDELDRVARENVAAHYPEVVLETTGVDPEREQRSLGTRLRKEWRRLRRRLS